MRIVTLVLCLLSGVGYAGPRTEVHRRVNTRHGPLHLWKPASYDREHAALVIYIHGYYDDVDTAWATHRLASQFRASGLDALFVACESPSSDADGVSWASLEELLAQIARVEALPEGRVVAIAHSGGYRTVARWLGEDQLDTIGLLDAGYGDLGMYSSWLARRSDRRLFDVGVLTVDRTDALHETLPQTVSLERFPPPERGSLPEDVRTAPVVYIRSRMGHMELVTRGVAIPMLLRAIDAPLVPDVTHSSPLQL